MNKSPVSSLQPVTLTQKELPGLPEGVTVTFPFGRPDQHAVDVIMQSIENLIVKEAAARKVASGEVTSDQLPVEKAVES